MNTILKKIRLIPSSLTYTTTLFVKLNSTNKTFISSVRVTLEILNVSNNPIIMWHGIQAWLIKLITSGKMS
jgi:hypothetical protein